MNEENLKINIKNKYAKFLDPNYLLEKEIYVSPINLLEFMYLMKHDKDLLFNILCDHTVVDHIEEGLFNLIYNIYSTEYNCRVIIIVSIPRNKPVIETVSKIWTIAEWQEREAYDFFGVLYNNHPDLRRLFLEDDWLGFPLRKDYKDNFILEI